MPVCSQVEHIGEVANLILWRHAHAVASFVVRENTANALLFVPPLDGVGGKGGLETSAHHR